MVDDGGDIMGRYQDLLKKNKSKNHWLGYKFRRVLTYGPTALFVAVVLGIIRLVTWPFTYLNAVSVELMGILDDLLREAEAEDAEKMRQLLPESFYGSREEFFAEGVDHMKYDVNSPYPKEE